MNVFNIIREIKRVFNVFILCVSFSFCHRGDFDKSLSEIGTNRMINSLMELTEGLRIQPYCIACQEPTSENNIFLYDCKHGSMCLDCKNKTRFHDPLNKTKCPICRFVVNPSKRHKKLTSDSVETHCPRRLPSKEKFLKIIELIKNSKSLSDVSESSFLDMYDFLAQYVSTMGNYKKSIMNQDFIDKIILLANFYYSLEDNSSVRINNSVYHQVANNATYEEIEEIVIKLPKDIFNCLGSYASIDRLIGVNFFKIMSKESIEFLFNKIGENNVFFYFINEDLKKYWSLLSKSIEENYEFYSSCKYLGFDCKYFLEICFKTFFNSIKKKEAEELISKSFNLQRKVTMEDYRRYWFTFYHNGTTATQRQEKLKAISVDEE